MDHLHMQADPRLIRLLSQANAEQLDGYLLVDLSISPLTQRLILRLHEQQRTLSLFQGTPEEGFSHIAPHLIRWGDLSATERNQVIDLDQQVPAFAWLWTSNEETPSPFSHLKSQMDMRLPNGDLAMLRYYDPHVWMKLMDILDEEQKKELIGPVQYWSVNVGQQRHVFDSQGTPI
ncbi:DUF4123 domain-containing protein [Halomonas huangheensis]|uniref:DUF4123 domain-containing protein n=1 Tax=Halomonas huangheensis TaxID=1178482 RepID=W1NAX3_9GAMM|nr:DUF4123 domain-containing protein [Halomonas huangheensis]ALM52431.1 hypothetical protein AR456_09160 [Halomonas huangheensis]ERL52648.1 hypothetical protein BJB45_18895 [Halomonas huangheensis]